MATINITNGTGQASITNGTYQASGTATGYNSQTFQPTSLNITSQTNTYAFTIKASGTLTLHVTENGTQQGTPIVGAVFYRTDQSGNTYGQPVTTNSNGDAVLTNVPYETSGQPVIYFKQTTSDQTHNFNPAVQNTTMQQQTSTIQIQNSLISPKTFTLTDEVYTNLPIQQGTISLQ